MIDDDQRMGYAHLVQHRFADPFNSMDEKLTDIPASGPEPVPKSRPAPEARPGTGKRERATPQGDGLDPTRYGDWEKNGRCIDF
ncbi:MAG: DUF1674 domain-containing protein [Burkholderiaceae bacterium]